MKAKQRKLLLQKASSSEGEWSASIISGLHWSLDSMVVKGISVPYYLSCPGKDSRPSEKDSNCDGHLIIKKHDFHQSFPSIRYYNDVGFHVDYLVPHLSKEPCPTILIL